MIHTGSVNNKGILRIHAVTALEEGCYINLCIVRTLTKKRQTCYSYYIVNEHQRTMIFVTSHVC